MTREAQRAEFANSQVDCEFFNEDLYAGIIIGAKWADEHPDNNRTYTKQQLIDMGFAFTTNGDIVTPEQSNEDLKKYLQYKKRKFIEEAVNWLVMNASDYAISITDDEDNCVVSLDMVEDFRKAMEK